MPYFTNRGIVPLPAAGGPSDEATAFLARLISDGSGDPGSTRNGQYTTLIDALVDGGVFDLLDVLHVYAADTTVNAKLNLISSSYTVVSAGGAAFTADEGYTLTVGSETINTGYNPTSGANFDTESASIGVWCLVCDAALDMLIRDNSNSGAADIYPRYTADNKFYTRINDTTNDGNTVANGAGFSLGVRNASGARASYKDGSSHFTATVSSSAVANDVLLIGNIPGAQVAAFCAGAGLDSTQQLVLYDALHDYLVAVGAV